MSDSGKHVLVAYATAQGSTKEIAEFVVTRLGAGGVRAEAHRVAEDLEVDGADAVVLGSAVHGQALLPELVAFGVRERAVLRNRPVWLFSVGMGPSLRGPVGAVLRRVVPPEITRVVDDVGARGYQAFAGVLLREGTSWGTRMMLRLCGGRYGDLRDWPAIDRWATEVGTDLISVWRSA